MIDTDTLRRFVRRCATAAAVLAAAIGSGACVSIYVDDLTFVRMRTVGPQERTQASSTLRHFLDAKGYEGAEIIEATVSTETDLVAEIYRDEGWIPHVTVWHCAVDRRLGAISNAWSLFEDGRALERQTFDSDPSALAVPREEKRERYFYTMYFRVRDTRASDYPPRMPHDVKNAPVDLCADFSAYAYMGSISLRTNAVTIPAAAFRDLFARP